MWSSVVNWRWGGLPSGHWDGGRWAYFLLQQRNMQRRDFLTEIHKFMKKYIMIIFMLCWLGATTFSKLYICWFINPHTSTLRQRSIIPTLWQRGTLKITEVKNLMQNHTGGMDEMEFQLRCVGQCPCLQPRSYFFQNVKQVVFYAFLVLYSWSSISTVGKNYWNPQIIWIYALSYCICLMNASFYISFHLWVYEHWPYTL